jgi:hypothetical protein
LVVARGGTDEAELHVTGSRVRETLEYSLRRGRAFFAACRDSRVEVGARPSWHPEELVVREFAQNAITWAALQHLGVREGSEITLDFFFETGGPHADHELAEFLTTISGYQAAVEPDGVSGRTQPMTVSPNALDDWARAMLYTGFEHGRCPFAGWSATLSR